MKEIRDIRKDVLGMSVTDFALLVGCSPASFSKIESKNMRHSAPIRVLVAIMRHDSFTAMKAVLNGCNALQRRKPLSVDEVAKIKTIAKRFMSHGEFVTWTELFEKRLATHYKERNTSVPEKQ